MHNADAATPSRSAGAGSQCRLEEEPDDRLAARPASRFRLALFLLGSLAALLVSVAIACGDGDDLSTERQLLEQMILKPEDIASGLERVTASFSTNQDVAEGTLDPVQELAKLEGFTRQLGYEVTYQSGFNAPADITIRAINNTASLYRDAEGASASFADGVETARTTDWLASHSDLDEVEVQEIPLEGIADEAFWIRVSGLQGEDGSTLLMDDFLLLRQDRVRSFLRVVHLVEASSGREAAIQQVRDWADRQAQLIEAALADSR